MLASCLSEGLAYADFLMMKLSEVDAFLDQVLHNKESIMNNALYVAHQQSALTSKAVWGKDFPKKAPTVDFTSKRKNMSNNQTQEEILESILEFQKSVHSEVKKLH